MNTTQSPQHEGRQYLHTLVAGVWLPLLQSTVTALVVAISVLAIAYFVFDARDPHKPAILFFVITWVYMIWKSQRHWWSLTTVEQIFQRDFDGDGVIGEATEQPEEEVKPRRVVIQVDTVKENGRYQVGDRTDQLKFSCSPQQLQTFATGVINGIPIAEKKWTPLKDGKLFSGNQWRTLMDEMLTQKIIRYVTEGKPLDGFEFTDFGRKVMTGYASPTPLPHLDV